MKTLLFAIALVATLGTSKVLAQDVSYTSSICGIINLAGASWPGWGCSCYGNIEDGCTTSPFSYKFNHPGIRPTSNGICGTDKAAAPVQSVFGVDLKPCCTQHDLDYGNCQKPKSQSDGELGGCITNSCSALAWNAVLYWTCVGVANGYQEAVTFSATANSAYVDTQAEVCLCSPCGPNFPCFYGGTFGSLPPLPQQPWYPWWPSGGGF